MMTAANKKALVVAYYLSRFDKRGFESLGFKSFKDATRRIGAIIGAKPRTIQGMRDEFDPYFENPRVGWVRKLSGSRLNVYEAFENVSEEALFETVQIILSSGEKSDVTEIRGVNFVIDDERPAKTQRMFTSRGPTGRAAEKFFAEYQKREQKPLKGRLIDTTDDGVGYDFVVRKGSTDHYFEVKGSADIDGGIELTDKEWEVAKKKGENYNLVIVRSVFKNPSLIVLNNPSRLLSPKMSFRKSVQIKWNVSAKDLREIKV